MTEYWIDTGCPQKMWSIGFDTSLFLLLFHASIENILQNHRNSLETKVLDLKKLWRGGGVINDRNVLIGYVRFERAMGPAHTARVSSQLGLSWSS